MTRCSREPAGATSGDRPDLPRPFGRGVAVRRGDLRGIRSEGQNG
ncbi:hypothetical protein ACFSEO_02340 [Agromyces cerinus subsp. nitratus]